MMPVDRLIAALEARGLSVRGSSERGWTAQCPAHVDRNASLSIDEGDDGRALLHCHAGCVTEDVLAALGLEPRDLFPAGDSSTRASVGRERKPYRSADPLPSMEQIGEWAQRLAGSERVLDRLHELRGWTREAIVGLGIGFDGQRIVFPIRDHTGELVNVCRYAPAPRPGERKIVSLTGRPRDLFPPPESLEGDEAWCCEGEPDGITAVSLGLPAVAIPGVEFANRLNVERFRRFQRVNVLLDCDAQGREAAATIAARLSQAGIEVRVLDLDPSRDNGYDLTDFTRETSDACGELRGMASNASPVQPPAVTSNGRGSTRGSAVNWPARLGDAAYHGLAGELVRMIEPHTEADPAAILASLLAAYGNVIGRGAGWKVGGTFHASNLFVLLVGPTSSGRKGTAGDEALRVLQMVDPEWAGKRVVNGLSTGEGLVWQVRDPISKRRKAKKDEIPNLPDGWIEEIEDPGEDDKRLFVVEAEFAQATKVMAREGNTLSPTLRRLWDRGDARSMVKQSPGRTTSALVSIVGHIGPEELRRQLGDAEIANGFANRFMIVCSRRSKRLPFGGNLSDGELARFVPRLREAIEHGRRSRELDMDQGARATWTGMYAELDEEHFGVLGSVLRRAVPIVRRLAVIYALLDCQPAVGAEHLRAAAALWRYCEESARFVFGDALGYRMADRLRRSLREANGAWLSRSEIRRAAGSNNIAAEELDAALTALLDHGLAEMKSEPTRGHPAELWRSTETWEQWEESPPKQPLGALSSHSSHQAAQRNGREALATPEEEELAERLQAEYGDEP